MHGLIKAGLLLAPALAGAAATSQENNPSAFLTLDLPESSLERGHPFLSMRLDVLESQSACGSANVTINGETLPKNGKLALPLIPDFDGTSSHTTSKKNTPSAVVSWESDCVSWGGIEREQIMRLRVLSVNGIDSKNAKNNKNIKKGAKTADAEDDVTTIRFSQTTPARIIMAEGAASSFLFNDKYYSTEAETELEDSNDDDKDFDMITDEDLGDDESADFAAWENSLILLHHHVALLHHDIWMREQYIADRFGPPAFQHAFGGRPPHGHPHPHSGPEPPCDDVSSLIGSFLHKVTDTAKAIYGGWVATTFGDDGPHGPHGPHHGHYHGPHHAFHEGPEGFAAHHGQHGHHSPWPAPLCFPGSGRNHSGPPPPPAAPPSFLFHCPSGLATPKEQGPPHHPHPHDHEGPAEVHAHDHQGIPHSPPHGPPHGPPRGPPPDGPHDHHHPESEPPHPPHHEKPHNEPHHKPTHEGPKEHGPDGPPKENGFHSSKTGNNKPHDGPHEVYEHNGPHSGPHDGPHEGPHPFDSPHQDDGPRRMHAPAIKMVAFSGLILVLFLVFVRHCSNRRIQKRLARRARRLRGSRGSTSGDSFERRERRRTRRARHSSGRGLFSSMRRFLSTREEFYEKIADDEADIEGVPECAEIPRPATPVVVLEEEVDEPLAVDVEEEETVVEAEDEQAVVAESVEYLNSDSKEQQELAPFHQPPAPVAPSPLMASASSVYSGYGRRDPVGIEADFDDTESLPPAYSSADYAYVNMIEASVVADGFQYRPSSF